jgi:competence protein ComEA
MTFRNVVSIGLGAALAALLSGSVLAAEAAKGGPVSKVNINTATVDQLTAVPGIGPKLAARIVEYRQKAGGYKSVQEVLNVKGIGEKSFEKLQPHLTIGDAPARAGTSK